MAEIEKPGPDACSSDYQEMAPYWDTVGAIMGGSCAVRRHAKRFLPKFPNEPQATYDVRLSNAVLANVFSDIVETLAAKPFTNEIEIETKSARVKQLIENIDGQGNHAHIFASNWFFGAVVNAIDWVLVDYTKGDPSVRTVADEAKAGMRPYWVQIPARNLIAVYSEMIRGVETIVHARIREDVVEREGYGEVTRERVRVMERELVRGADGGVIDALPATWELLEKQRNKDTGKEVWVQIANGGISIEVIPLVPLITGKRIGSSWRIRPPMEPCADLQIEHYQQASAEKHLYSLAAFPIITANGISPPESAPGVPSPIAIGPMSVLYAPTSGEGSNPEWKILDPAGPSMDKVSARLDRIERQMRELGRQPLTAQSGNITTVTAAFAGDKAMTVIEAWVMNAKDAIENALRLTAMWLKEEDEPEVDIDTDFLIGMKENDGSEELGKARERGDLSQETYWSELKRRGTLSPNFDNEAERERLVKEAPGELTQDEIDAANVGATEPPDTGQDSEDDPTQNGSDDLAAA